MKSKAVVSIIIPIYNSEKYLERCIESIINQTYKNLEIILINDGSTDSSVKICDEYRQKDDRIVIVNTENSGVSTARNIGLDIAKGNYIFFMDSDDFLDNTVIEDLLLEIDDYELIKVSYRIINKKIRNINLNGVYNDVEYINEIILGNIGGYIWGYLIKKELLKDMSFNKNTSCMEDALFLIECVLKTKKIKIINKSFYNYIINENGITSSKSKIMQNIKDYNYSLDKIKEIMPYEEFYLKIEKKRVILLEKEIAKVDSMIELKNILDNLDTKILKNYNNFYYNTIVNCILKKRYKLLYCIMYIRRIIKNILK